MGIFQPEAQYKQLPHCNFRENIVRLLYIPNLTTIINANNVTSLQLATNDTLFLIVNKFGKVGLYDPVTFKLIHTYLLDLTTPMHPKIPKSLQIVAKKNLRHEIPKCSKTHLVIDATYCPDFKTCLFLTTKGILQCYDIGEIESQSIGLEIFPRQEFMGLKYKQRFLPVNNFGHVETHRVYQICEFPTCIYYHNANQHHKKHQDTDTRDVSNSSNTRPNSSHEILMSKILIGDSKGCITIIFIDYESTGHLFGIRKIRGMCHEIIAMDLFQANHLKVYKGHNNPVSQVSLLIPRQMIVSCSSRDHKYTLVVNDLLVQSSKQPQVISHAKGVNTFAHSNQLKMIVTGSDDHILRLYNDFMSKLPEMELHGHNAPIVGVAFLNVHFSKTQILISYSKDVDIKAWDPKTFTCLQSLYISFPPNSIIICKTPEFAKNCLYLHQPQYESSQCQLSVDPKASLEQQHKVSSQDEKEVKPLLQKQNQYDDGEIILFYCNSFAKLHIEKDASNWPFNFDEFVDEFEETKAKYEIKLKQKLDQQESILGKMKMRSFVPKTRSNSKSLSCCVPKSASESNKTAAAVVSLTEVELAGIEQKLDLLTNEILTKKTSADKKLGIRRNYDDFAVEIDRRPKMTPKESADESSASAPISQGLGLATMGNPNMNMSLSTQGMRKFHSIERAKALSSKQSLINQGFVFKSLPIFDMEPISFRYFSAHASTRQMKHGHGNLSGDEEKMSPSLPVTDSMRHAGIKHISSIQDLLTNEAKEYFSQENMNKLNSELALMERTLKSDLGAGGDIREGLSDAESEELADGGSLMSFSKGSPETETNSSRLEMESDLMTVLAEERFGDEYGESLVKDMKTLCETETGMPCTQHCEPELVIALDEEYTTSEAECESVIDPDQSEKTSLGETETDSLSKEL